MSQIARALDHGPGMIEQIVVAQLELGHGVGRRLLAWANNSSTLMIFSSLSIIASWVSGS
jgi:hypothetical protein